MMKAISDAPGRLKLLGHSSANDLPAGVEVFESAEKLLTVAQGYAWVERPNGETVTGGAYTLEQAREDFEAGGQVGHCYECDGEIIFRPPLFACGCTTLEAGSEALHPAWNLALPTLRRLRGETRA